jgi:nucleotide-binding universal stress UspA family protein
MWTKLLVPHDFSLCAARALETAAELAKIHGSELVLVHVSDLPANLAPDMLVAPTKALGLVRVDDYTTRGAVQQLEQIAEPLRRQGIPVVTQATTGDVVEQILAIADRARADALVMGTHGRSGLPHLLQGSVTERVLRAASVPVVCVRVPGPLASRTNEERDIEDELAG